MTDNFDDNLKWFERGILCCFLLGCVVVISITFEWFVSSREEWERDAVKAGAAEYRINPTNYAKEFHWKDQPK